MNTVVAVEDCVSDALATHRHAGGEAGMEALIVSQ